MTNSPLALRSGQADVETEMWARYLIRFLVDGKPPPVPLLVTEDDYEQIREGVLDALDALVESAEEAEAYFRSRES